MSILKGIGPLLKRGVSFALDFFTGDAEKTQQITGLSNRVSSLSSDIDAANQLRESLLTKINTAQATTDDELRKAKSELETVNHSIEEMEREFAEVKAALEGIVTMVLELKEKVDKHDEKLVSHDQKLASHDQEFSEVRVRLSALEEQNKQMMTYVFELGEVKGKQKSLEEKVEKEHKRVDRVENKVNKLDCQVSLIRSVLKTDDEKSSHLLFLDSVKDDEMFKGLHTELVCVVRRSLNPAQFEKIKKKPNVLVLAKTTEGRFFGFWFTKPLQRLNQKSFDPTITAFVIRPDDAVSFQTFPVRSKHAASIFVYPVRGPTCGFFNVGVDRVGQLWIGTENSDSYCENLSAIFEGLDDRGLTGHSGQDEDQRYHCESVVVYQFTKAEEDECEAGEESEEE